MQPKAHKQISKDAAVVYRACTGHAIPEELLSAFAVGTVDEDNWWILTRITNWHFYNNRNKLSGRYRLFGIIPCKGSNEHIYGRRLEELKMLIGRKESGTKMYAMAGRAAHHVQDMSSPPHIMPIYHTAGDKFDKYVPTSGFDPVTVTRADIDETDIELSVLLKKAADITLRQVEKPVQFDNDITDENETWMKFWGGEDDEKRLGFRKYGKYGNVFGVISSHDRVGSSPTYSKTVFDRFYTACYRRAVVDTVRFFNYLYRNTQT